ncbi:MAG: peptide transporter [Ruminococcus sp.]|nr:peptide transporter [Ruminococcus sp.]
MKNFIRLTDFTSDDIFGIFRIADDLNNGKYNDFFKGKSVVMFFPDSSIRTRITFEKGVYLLGGQTIMFPPSTLDKKEDIRDVCGYLGNWADAVIVRHNDISKLDKMAEYSDFPIINALTDVNHPCEILSDLYALSKIRNDFTKDKYLFCGKRGNIGNTWKSAADVLGLDLVQCCCEACEIDGVPVFYDINEAIVGRDVVCTDTLPAYIVDEFDECRVTKDAMDKANKGAVLNPCPPFFRGEEVSAEVIDSDYFVGYGFKKHLLTVQQAILIYCMGGAEK